VLCHVLDVLVDNALRHGKGPIRLMWRPAADAVVVSVGDDGPGFGGAADGDAVPVASGELHGLGLPLARRLTESMSGRLSIARSGPRPRIDITLPAALPRPA
jgi:signal transduction histidine kinase